MKTTPPPVVRLVANEVSDIPADVSPEQWTAIEKLSAGSSIIDAAAAAGVSRSTLHRWIKVDPHFQAAYNAWHTEVLATARARLLALTDSAVTVVAVALCKNDTKTALTLLKSQGLLNPTKLGLLDAKLIAQNQSTAARRDVARADWAEDIAAVPPIEDF